MIKSICTCIHVVISGLVQKWKFSLHYIIQFLNMVICCYWGGGAVKHINQLLYLFLNFLYLLTGQSALFQITASILLWIF